MPGSEDMLRRLSEAFPALQDLIFMTAWLLGLFLVGNGLLHLLRRHRASGFLRPAAYSLIAGSLLLSLPATMETMTASLFADTDPRQILSATRPGMAPGATALHVMMDFLALIGWISGVRGLYLIACVDRMYVPDAFGRGFTHFMGGVFLVNLSPFAHAIGGQLGVESHVSGLLEGYS